MKSRIPTFLGLFLTLAGGQIFGAKLPASPASGIPSVKRAAVASRLLVPYFEVDMADPAGPTTLISVRNEIVPDLEVRISIFAPDSPQTPFHSEVITLSGKQLKSLNIRTLLAGQTGLVRGFVVFETVSGSASIQGDYYEIDPRENFANGRRLVNIDPASEDNDLCSVFSIRFLNGGAFNGGTVLSFWLDLDLAPAGTNVISYAVYNESGELVFFTDLPAVEVTFRKTVVELTAVDPTNFGVIELQMNDGIRGHVSAVMSALGRYSVGLEAVCRD